MVIKRKGGDGNMKFISLKISKLVIMCTVILTGLILITGSFLTALGDEQSIIDTEEKINSETASEKDNNSTDNDDEVENEVMEIFPRDDYEDWDIEPESEFFVEYKLERDKIRNKEIDKLNQLMENPKASQVAKESAEDKLMEILNVIEKEMLIENLIKAYGFEDAILFYREDSATVVVKSEGLSEIQVHQIVELVSDKTGVGINDVKVVENI